MDYHPVVASLVATVLGLLALYPFALLLTAVHEAGHLAVGAMCRLSFKSLRIGPIEAEQSASRRLTWKWASGWTKFFRGCVVMFPGSLLPHIRIRYALFILGGPFFNALFATLAFPFALRSDAFGGCCRLIVLGSAGAAILNLVPRDTKSGRSDGGSLYDLAFRPLERDRVLLKFCLIAQLRQVRSLTASHRLAEALALLDEQIRLFDTLLREDARAQAVREQMFALRPKLEQAILTCNQNSASENAADLVTGAENITSPA